MNASKKAQKEMGVQECFQVPPAELVVPHQTFEKLLPLINLHERSLLGLFLSNCSCFVLGPVCCSAGCYVLLVFSLSYFSKETMDRENLCVHVCIVIVLPDQLFF